MKLKNQRLLLVVVSGVFISAAVAVMLIVFRDNLVFFYSPTELQTRNITENQRIRVGGLVESGSIRKNGGDLLVEFRVTDLDNSLEVKYSGLLPPMFREEQGMVAEGYLRGEVFEAEKLMTKHDENYMPPEVAESLKKSGKWKGAGQAYKQAE